MSEKTEAMEIKEEETVELIEMQLQKVSIKAGDVIVLMCDECLTKQAYQNIVREAKRIFPDNKVVILEEGMKIGVLAKKNTSEDSNSAIKVN